MIGKTNCIDEINKTKIPIPENTSMLLHFEENLIDETNLNTLSVPTADEVYTDGKFGKAIQLNGNNFIKIPISEANTLGSNDFTIAGWFKLDAYTGNHCLFSNSYSKYYAGLQIWLSKGNGKVSFLLSYGSGSGSYTRKDIAMAIETDVWYHFALVRNGSTVTVYMNGTDIGSITFSSSLYQNASTSWRIGSSNVSATATAPREGYIGLVDEFIMVNGKALWTEDFVPPALPYK